MQRWEFWAKRRDPIGREIDVTVIAYAYCVEHARAKVDALGVHYDVAVYTDDDHVVAASMDRLGLPR